MKKIFRLSLMVVFVLSVINCKYNTDEIPLIPLNRPVSPFPSLPFPLPLDCEYEESQAETSIQDQLSEINIQDQLFLYTDEQLHELRQNLVGRYRGITNDNREISFDILLNHVPVIRNIQPGQHFVVILLCLRNHYNGDNNYNYNIVFRPGSLEIIGLRAVSNNFLVEYFDKLETNEREPHV